MFLLYIKLKNVKYMGIFSICYQMHSNRDTSETRFLFPVNPPGWKHEKHKSNLAMVLDLKCNL